MNTRHTLLLTALASFTGGFLTGVLLAPESRQRVAAGVRSQARWVGQQLHTIEAQLNALERQIDSTSATLGRRIRSTTRDALDPFVPSVPEGEEKWRFEGEDVAQDLRRMPRR